MNKLLEIMHLPELLWDMPLIRRDFNMISQKAEIQTIKDDSISRKIRIQELTMNLLMQRIKEKLFATIVGKKVALHLIVKHLRKIGNSKQMQLRKNKEMR